MMEVSAKFARSVEGLYRAAEEPGPRTEHDHHR
jgi:hypothetical protein